MNTWVSRVLSCFGCMLNESSLGASFESIRTLVIERDAEMRKRIVIRQSISDWIVSELGPNFSYRMGKKLNFILI